MSKFLYIYHTGYYTLEPESENETNGQDDSGK